MIGKADIYGNGTTEKVSLINPVSLTGSIPAIKIGKPGETFYLEIIMEVKADEHDCLGYIPLPFQVLETVEIVGYVFLGWHQKNVADLTLRSDKSERKLAIDNGEGIYIDASIVDSSASTRSGSLLCMYGPELKNGGGVPTFASRMSWTILKYHATPQFFNSLSTEFPEMWNEFYSTGTLAIGVRINIRAAVGSNEDGFFIGATNF